MDARRLFQAAVRCAGIVCAVLSITVIVRSYAALRAAAEAAGLPLDGAPASLWPYVGLMAAGLLAGELAGRWTRTRATP